jgi:hypothetical protein
MGVPLSAVLVALGAFNLIGICIMLFQLAKQHGPRIFFLDGSLEQTNETADRCRSAGLAATPVPLFSFPSLAGQTIALGSFPLVSWGPQCGFSDMSAADVSNLRPDFPRENVGLSFRSHLTPGYVRSSRLGQFSGGQECEK